MSQQPARTADTVTPDDLLKIARDRSAQSRGELASIIADLFSDEGRVLTNRERQLMSNILERVFKEVELAVRKEVATRLASQAGVPEDLISLLANDDIQVAYPILSESPVIRDEELIEVIRHRTKEHQLAVAIRNHVSEAVSDELVKQEDESVVTTLLDNPNAKISQTTMEYIVEQSRRFNSIQEPLLRREDLPGELAQRMYLWVSAALRSFIVDRYELDQGTMDDLLQRAALQQAPGSSAESKASKLAETMFLEGKADTNLLISTLNQGEVRLFIALLARMSGLREKLVTRFVYEASGEGLAIACRALGMKLTEFTIVFSLTQQERAQQSKSFQKELASAKTFFERVPTDAARAVVRKWQLNQEYLATLRELEAALKH